MKAVNLIPPDDRSRGLGAGTGSGTGGMVYVLLGGLAVLVVLVGLSAYTGRQVATSEAKLERVNREAQAVEARAAKIAPYEAYAALASARVSTVTSLSATRFDWAHSLRELSRVLPGDVWLSTLQGSSGAGSEPPAPNANAAPAPTFEMVGCTRTQAKVARLMARLRAVDGVRDVRLKTSEKPDTDGDKSCPANRRSDPKFTIVIAFKAPTTGKESVDASGQVATKPPAAAPPGGAPAGSTPPPADSTPPTSTPATSIR